MILGARGGVQIISRHQIEEVHAHVFNTRNTETGEKYVNRGVVLAKVMVPSGPVWVMGTHLNSAAKYAGIRARQAAEITKWIDERVKKGKFDISRDDDIVILAGDMNVRMKTDGEGACTRGMGWVLS